MIEIVLIGGIQYPINRVKDLRDGDQKLDGHIKYRPYSINLDTDLGSQGERVVLWHEILHGILAQAGWEHRGDEYEQFIDALAYGIVQVLQDNPELRGAEQCQVG